MGLMLDRQDKKKKIKKLKKVGQKRSREKTMTMTKTNDNKKKKALLIDRVPSYVKKRCIDLLSSVPVFKVHTTAPSEPDVAAGCNL